MIRWLKSLFTPKPERLALRLVSYRDADQFIADGWTIAPEEDANRHIGFVYLERLAPQHTAERSSNSIDGDAHG